MFKWLFHIVIFSTNGKYQNKEKPLKRQRKLGLGFPDYKRVSDMLNTVDIQDGQLYF